MRYFLVAALIPGAIHAQTGTDIYLAGVSRSGDAIAIGAPTNVTERAGYDNQPSFTPDGRMILFTSIREDGQADTYRYDVEHRSIARVTHTAESEYSPTVMPGGTHFSVIQVEADSTQRLWKFRLDGSAPELVLTDVKPVGYHAWVDAHTLGLFVLGNPSTLQIADTRTGAAEVAARNIGRSLHKVPGEAAISFLHQTGPEPYSIKAIDAQSRTVRQVAPALPGNEYYAWLPDGTPIMGTGSKLSVWAEDARRWVEIADLAESGVTEISRLAVSPDGRTIAIVADDSER